MKEMFGKDQLSAMADLVQGSLMLRYNKRRVGRAWEALPRRRLKGSCLP